MGSVYRALHLRFGEIRALKVLAPQLAADALFVKRFEQEAVLTRKLQHPNAVRIEDIDESEDGQPFIVMEYIEGRSLREVIDSEAPLDPARVCSLAIQIASALGAAHGLGIVHRDVKPENAVLVHSELPEKVKVLDFGIAKVKQDLSSSLAVSLTQTGMAIGTPAYMSPEQASASEATSWMDARTSTRSASSCTKPDGKKPIAGDTPMQVLIGQIQAPPILILEARRRIGDPVRIAALVMRCLEKEPALRPATAGRLTAALEQCACRSQTKSPSRNRASARRTARGHRTPRSPPRRPPVRLEAAERFRADGLFDQALRALDERPGAHANSADIARARAQIAERAGSIRTRRQPRKPAS